MSDHSDHEPNLLDRILETEPGIKSALSTHAVAQDTVLDLQGKPPAALVQRFSGMRMKQAQRLKDRLDVATAAMMRVFRENRLSAATRRAADELKGPLAQSNGPTFENQFSPSWGNHTHPQAVDATTSPAAYLIDLLTFVEKELEPEGNALKAVTLKTRRPDLYDLSLDEDTMNRTVTQVEVVNHVMESAIERQRKMANDTTATQDKLLQVRYPLKQFPYEHYWEQIRTVLAHHELSVSDISRLSDIDAPYFIQPGAHSQWSDVALQQDAGLGPALRAILLEAPYFGTGGEVRFNPQTRRLLAPPHTSGARRAEQVASNSVSFFKDNFGVQAYPTLQNVVNFCQALHMSQDEMESLFALAAYAPVRSDNVVVAAPHASATSVQFGARFINSGSDNPVSVVSDNAEPTLHHFQHLTEDRCDRINRLMRLATALKLSYAETDQIVCAAIEAERRAAISQETASEAPLWMTANTIRALGVFQFLRERFSCGAEDFSALLSDMSIFASGDTLSHFDRVFNADTTTPLVLDYAPFSLGSEDVQSKRTVDQLCQGLGINMETFRYLSRLVMQGQSQPTLVRTLSTVSAFYRITLLARLLSITTIELLSLLEVLSPEGQYALQLAGAPQNAMYNSYIQTDTLSVIHALSRCVAWCQAQQLPIAWLVQQLLPVETTDVVPEEYRTLLGELKSHLVPFQDFDRLLAEAGVAPLRTQSWMQNLTQIVDAQGLITDTGHSEEDFDPVYYEHFAAREIEVVIQRLMHVPKPEEGEGDGQTQSEDSELPLLTADEAERLKTLILGVVLRIRSQQWGVVQERLSHFLSLKADSVIPVIYWAGGKAHTLLESATNFEPDQLQSEALKAMMPLMQRMQRCARVVNQFALSPAMFSSLLVRAQRPRWSIKSTELTLQTLYFLERYSRCLRQAKQSEEQLLGYFDLIESLGELSPNEHRLIKDAAAEKIAAWLGWGIREVLDVAAQVTSDGIIRNLAQLCALVDTRQLCEKTGLSAGSLMKLSRLSGHSDTQAYRSAAHEVLSSLRQAPEQRRDEVELRQSLSTRCLVSNPRLVANKSDEETAVSLTLLDMNNQPVSDIRVRWSTDLGSLLEHYSYTDEQGIATVRLQAGQQIGVARVQATYLLDSKAFAPPVVIDCYEPLRLHNTVVPKKPVLAGNRGRFDLQVQLFDDLGNRGVDRLVNWTSSIGEFIDSSGETLTDSEGISRISLRSMQAGKGIVALWYAGNPEDVQQFEVVFDELPYVGSLALTSWAVVNDDISVSATIRALDGNPYPKQALKWACTGADLVSMEELSDENGQAKAVLSAKAAGLVEVTVTLSKPDDTEGGYYTETLSFEVLSNATCAKPSSSGKWPLADGISAAEYALHIVSDDGKPVERYPVTWNVQEGDIEAVTSLTGPDGIAHYLLKSTQVGERTVVASWGDDGSYPFGAVTFLPEQGMEILFEGQPVDGPGVITQPTEGEVEYTLSCRLPAGHPLLEAELYLLYYGRFSASSLGLHFNPELGVAKSFEAPGVQMDWKIKSKPTGLNQEASLQLGVSYVQAMEPIWIDVIVKPSPA
ncbi:Ig-like domain-containing protein [Pseudomonas guariconensis]|uniref:Ig-like domain-containing protein n=1 Tax=Pseudomonas guariconensis TaxID=1288410 RepID=UPI002FE64937